VVRFALKLMLYGLDFRSVVFFLYNPPLYRVYLIVYYIIEFHVLYRCVGLSYSKLYVAGQSLEFVFLDFSISPSPILLYF